MICEEIVDGKQEVKVYLRSVQQMIEVILAGLRFRYHQYLHFKIVR
jgi:hypothetical protein